MMPKPMTAGRRMSVRSQQTQKHGSLSLSEGSMAYVTWWYLRLLGLVYMAAFASLYVQLPGLYGCDGLLPGERRHDNASRSRLILPFLFYTFVHKSPM